VRAAHLVFDALAGIVVESVDYVVGASESRETLLLLFDLSDLL